MGSSSWIRGWLYAASIYAQYRSCDHCATGLMSQCEMALARKLKALGYHSPDNVDVKDEEQLKALVVWLEDQKIRHYKIEDRAPLREKNGKEWMDAFRTYLKDLECPFLECDASAVLSACEWTVGLAVKYEFEEECESYPELKAGLREDTVSSRGPSNAAGESKSVPSSFSIDPGDADLVEGCSVLGRLLHITPHPDVGVTLEAVRLLVEERLAVIDQQETTEVQASSSAKEEEPSSEKKLSNVKKKADIEIAAKDCGFNLRDPTLNEAAKTLRVLHVRELRTLQTQINELVVTVQAMTADPKADHTLGKVGK